MVLVYSNYYFIFGTELNLNTMKTDYLEIEGVELLVEYDYYPSEQAIRYYSDGSGHPGNPSTVELSGIYLEGNEQDISELMCGRYKKEIEEELIKINEEW